MDFLTQLGVLAIILIILVILIKSNQTLEQIYMEGEVEKDTIQISSFKMPKIKFSRSTHKNAYEEDEFLSEQEMEAGETDREERMENKKTNRKGSVERAGGTIPMEIANGWFVEILDDMGRAYGRKMITDYPFTIGRCDDNDFVLDDLSVSSHHAAIEEKSGILELVDQGSLNKIFVNGQKTSRSEVENRMEASLGNIRIRFGKEEPREQKTTACKRNSLMEEWY